MPDPVTDRSETALAVAPQREPASPAPPPGEGAEAPPCAAPEPAGGPAASAQELLWIDEVAERYLAPALRAAAAAKATAARIRAMDMASAGWRCAPGPRAHDGLPDAVQWRGLSVAEAAHASTIAFRPLRGRTGSPPHLTRPATPDAPTAPPRDRRKMQLDRRAGAGAAWRESPSEERVRQLPTGPTRVPARADAPRRPAAGWWSWLWPRPRTQG